MYIKCIYVFIVGPHIMMQFNYYLIRQNDAERKWIRRLTWNSNDRAFLDKVPIILDELDKEQIGMGKGQFLIDESFLYRVC